MEKPLVSFILLAYNQQTFIREAVEAALAQSYQPLEIILSDDCSPDQTFQLMKQLVKDYDGPHRVILNRCEQNMGLAGHINEAMKISSGELIVSAAGDDISLPHRVETLTKAWIDSGKKSGSVYSGYFIIDQDGNKGDVRTPKFKASDTSYLVENPESIWNIGAFGCAHAWTKDVFEIFGGLMPNVVYEDRVIPFRSALLGNVSFVTDPLIMYRRLPESLSRSHSIHNDRKEKVANYISYYKKREIVLINNQRDLETARIKNLVSEDDFEQLRETLAKEIKRSNVYQELLQNGFFDRLGIAFKNGSSFSLTQRMKFWFVALVPWIYGARTTSLINKAKKLFG